MWQCEAESGTKNGGRSNTRGDVSAEMAVRRMKISIQYSIIPSQDTLRYEFYIRDRAMNQSNMAYTTDIGFH